MCREKLLHLLSARQSSLCCFRSGRKCHSILPNGQKRISATKGEEFMRLTRRSFVMAATAAPWLARTAPAQNWPSGIIKIIVPFPPGGTVDPIARMA
jgi:hypothetical protein